ncbi:MAG: hypothetical protein ACAI25_04055 [Planctomycetota bacterium]
MALGILALLTMLVVSFALLTQIETSAATNYREGERARTLAKSGIERAQAELRRAVTTPGYPLPWLGYDTFDYDLNARKNPTAQMALVKPSLLDIGIKGTSTGNPGIDATRSPSLGMFFELPAKMPKGLLDRSIPWPSGVLGSSYYTDPDNTAFRGDYYSLRIVDTSSQLFLNDENPRIGDMIDDLVWGWHKFANLTPPPDGLGAKIAAARPADGFRRLEELKAISALTTADRGILDSIMPYLTTVSRVDQKVVEMGSQGGRASYLSIQPRAAINMNTASGPVLVAALAGATSPVATVGRQTAFDVAKKMITYRHNPSFTDEGVPTTGQPANQAGNPPSQRWGFQHWGEFKQFLMRGGQGAGLSEAVADTVLASANPNTDLNKFVPDQVVDHIVDKNDLTGGGTELCFGSGGVFLVESLGIVLDPTGKPIATAKARAVIRAFERYVETTQADFEAGRIDPAGGAGLIGLRDIASLPEARNAIDARILGDLTKDDKAPGLGANNHAGMHAADYDGQLTFNVITRTKVAQPLGVYVGFIDRTVEGSRADSGTTPLSSILHIPGPQAADTKNTAQKVLGFVLEDGNPTHPNPAKRRLPPNYTNGSDYGALCAHLGRVTSAPGATTTMAMSPSNGRVLAYQQADVVRPEEINFAEAQVTIETNQIVRSTAGGVIGKINFLVSEKITDWPYTPIFRQGFEFWFKPARRTDNPSKIILLDWMAGGIQRPPAEVEDKLESFEAETVGGPTSLFNPAAFEAAVKSIVPDPRFQNGVTWGAGARLTIWLESQGNDNYQLHCRFQVTKPYDDSARFLPGPPGYDKTWVYQNPIHTGTWHHALMSWESPADKDDCPGIKGERSLFFADGTKVNGQKTGSTGEPDWPTEIGPKGQLVIAAVKNLERYINEIVAAEIVAAGGAAARGSFTSYVVVPDPEVYRAPAQVSPGRIVTIAHRDVAIQPDCPDFTNTQGGYRFLGLMDNICFHSRWFKTISSGDLNGEPFLPRYDTYRPSQGDAPGDSTASGFKALTFTKHTHALDWGKPIRIVAYDVTAWKHVNTGEAADIDATEKDQTVLDPNAGKVYFRFGFMDTFPQPNGTGPVGAVPPLTQSYDPATQDAPAVAWTPRLNGGNGTPYNCVANGFLIPAREAKGRGGFLTKGPNEYTLYAIEMYPFKDAITGPRMAPIVDDVNVVYLRWDNGTIIEEEEVVDTE